jgi:hypothetical protein
MWLGPPLQTLSATVVKFYRSAGSLPQFAQSEGLREFLKPRKMRWCHKTLKTKKKLKLHGLTFADRGCHVVSVTDPSGRILGFLDRSRYFSIK